MDYSNDDDNNDDIDDNNILLIGHSLNGSVKYYIILLLYLFGACLGTSGRRMSQTTSSMSKQMWQKAGDSSRWGMSLEAFTVLGFSW